MNDKKDFETALKGKKVPLLVLDQKWHRLFAIHGKTDEISATEKELDELKFGFCKVQAAYDHPVDWVATGLAILEMTAMKSVTRISSL